MLAQNLEKDFSKISHVDGSDNVPPTHCLRSAYIPAYAAVYAEATGSRKPSSTGSCLVLTQVG
jgi:hypothetical protein